MKKILLFISILILCATNIFALNFEVIVHDTIATKEPGDEVVLEGIIINTSNKFIDVEIIRETNVLPAGWTSALCLDMCAAPWVNSLTTSLTAGDSAEFSIHFLTDETPGTGEALIKIKENNETDFISYLFTGSTESSSVILFNDSQNKTYQIHNNYPNPFNNETIFSFETSEPLRYAKIHVYSIMGKLLYETKYSNLSSGTHRIFYNGKDFNNNILPSGTYSYKISLNTMSGKQLIKSAKFTLLK